VQEHLQHQDKTARAEIQGISRTPSTAKAPEAARKLTVTDDSRATVNKAKNLK
jgi:hypothetical protein